MRREVKLKGYPVPVGSVLNKLMARRGWMGRLNEAMLIQFWRHELGNEINRHTNPVCLKGRTLFVDVDEPIWANELSLLKRDIIEKLNSKLGKKVLLNVVFKLGKI